MKQVTLTDAAKHADKIVGGHMVGKARSVADARKKGGVAGIHVALHKFGVSETDLDDVLTREAMRVVVAGTNNDMPLSVIYKSLIMRGILIGAAARHLATEDEAVPNG